MKELAIATLVAGGVCTAGAGDAVLPLTREWDKIFPKSDKVEHCKATFRNRFGITLAADVYKPKAANGKLPAIAVSGPFGAVKEQSSGIYAQTLAERGFLTIAFDPSFTGESGGEPRYVASPDINTEDFQAAVDYLISRDDVDAERIGILGICGWGGLAINAAAVDTRVKATVASTMYDMTRVTANGYFDKEDSPAARKAKKVAMNAQRVKDFKSGTYELGGGVVDPLPADAPQFVKDYYDHYKTPRVSLVHKRETACIRGRNRERGDGRPRRKGAQPLLRRRRFQASQRRQQGACHCPRSVALRPLRQDGRDSVRPDRGVLQEASQLRVSHDFRLETSNGRNHGGGDGWLGTRGHADSRVRRGEPFRREGRGHGNRPRLSRQAPAHDLNDRTQR